MTHDYAILQDGTHKAIDEFEPGTLFVACNRGEIRKIVHVRQPRPLAGWRESDRLARRTDPDTSQQAAEHVTAIGSRADHLARIVAAVKARPGRTSAELAEDAGLERHEAARRTADAANTGHIVRGPSRTCSVGGRPAITWWPKRATVPHCPQPESPWRPAA